MRIVYFSLLLTFLLYHVISCQIDGEPKNILSQEKMVEVLYDYQVASALGQQAVSQKEQEEALRFKLSVFAKHRITQSDFDNSLAYYSRNSDEMKNVYREMQKRYNVQGTLLEENNSKPSEGAYDTLIIWNRKLAVLNEQLDNRFSTVVSPGNKLRRGGDLALRFGLAWQYAQGVSQATALLVVELNNDSVLQTTSDLYSYMNAQELRLRIDSLSQVKRVLLQVYQKSKWDKGLQTIFLRNIELINIVPKQQTSPASNSSSTPPTNTPSIDTSTYARRETL